MRFLRSRPGVTFFAFFWLLVLFVPILNEPMRGYANNESFVDPRTNITFSFPYWPLPRAKPQTTRVMDIVDRFRSSNANQRRVLLELEKVADQYPADAAWILALRLRLTTSSGIEYPLPQPPKKGLTFRATWLDKSALQEAIQCAQRGQRLDPKNAYFFQMEAIFDFGRGDDDNGLKALKQGAKCSGWNDYIINETLTLLDSAESRNPVLFEGKMAIWAAILLPHYAPLRSAHRLTAEKAVDLLKHGQKKQAIELFEVVMRNGRLIRQGSTLLIGYLVGRACEGMPWVVLEKMNRAAKAPGHTVAGTIQSNTPQDLAAWQKRTAPFIALCRDNGRPDLVKFTQNEIKEFDTQNPTRWYNNNPEELFGLPLRSLQFATTVPFFAAMAALLAWCGALFWIFGKLWPGSTQGEAAPRRGQIVGAANFSFWALLGAFALLAWKGVGSYVTAMFYGSDGEEATLNSAVHGYFPFIVLALWLVPVAVVSWLHARKNPTSPTPFIRSEETRVTKITDSETSPKPRRLRLQVVVVGVFVILAAVFGSISFLSDAGVWEDTPLQSPIPLIGFFASLLVACFLSRESLSRLSGMRKRKGGLVFVFGFASLFFISYFSLKDMGYLIWVLPLCAIGGMVLFGLKNRSAESDLTDNPPAPILYFAIHLAGQTAGVLALGFSMMYLLLALLVWPTRAQLDRNVEMQITKGEMSWLRQQATGKSQSTGFGVIS